MPSSSPTPDFANIDLSAFLTGPSPGEAAFPTARQQDVARAVDASLRGSGVFYVHNLAVDDETLNDMCRQSAALFAPPSDVKRASMQPMLPGSNMGYLPHNIEGLNPERGAADIKEVCLHFCSYQPTDCVYVYICVV